MSERILVLDYDGVIADTNSLKSEWIADNLGISVPPGLCDRTNCTTLNPEDKRITVEEYNTMSDYVYGPEASLRARPIPDAVRHIQTLATTHRLYIVTARTQAHMVWAREWLAQHRIADAFENIVSSVVRNVEKSVIADELNACAMVDDDVTHFRNSERLHFEKYHFAQYETPGIKDKDNAAFDGIHEVRDWKTLFQLLLERC